MFKQNKFIGLLSFLVLVAAVAAFPVSDGTDTPQDGKYAKDKGVSRSVLSYIFGAAGCVAVLGVMFFAFCKWRRGERVLGMQRKPPNNCQRTAKSMYSTDNPYGRHGQSVDMANMGQEDLALYLNKPLPRLRVQDHGHREHEVRMPAPVARPSQHAGRHVSFPPVIHTSTAGYYSVPLQSPSTAAPDGNRHPNQAQSHIYR
jgi:hypothetical protein